MTMSTKGQRVHGRRADSGRPPARSGWGVLALAAAFAVAVPAEAWAQNGPSTVSTYGEIYRYTGPLGGVIRQDGTVDTSVQSWFRDVANPTSQSSYGPSDPYPGYEDPAFEGTGTGSVNLYRLPGFPTLTQGIQFWTQFGPTPPSQCPSEVTCAPLSPPGANLLRIQGHTTTGVTIDPVTRTSADIRIATITFANGDWYPTTPGVDAGYGVIAPTSRFDFSIVASASPSLGNPTLLNPPRHVFNGSLVLTSTFGLDPMTGLPAPDYLQLVNNRGEPSFASSVLSVDEGMTGTVELWGRIGSLIPTYFANPSGGVQILSSIPVTPVPEPATMALMLAGLAVVGGAARRRERTRAA